jgi:acetate kinase
MQTTLLFNPSLNHAKLEAIHITFAHLIDLQCVAFLDTAFTKQ